MIFSVKFGSILHRTHSNADTGFRSCGAQFLFPSTCRLSRNVCGTKPKNCWPWLVPCRVIPSALHYSSIFTSLCEAGNQTSTQNFLQFTCVFMLSSQPFSLFYIPVLLAVVWIFPRKMPIVVASIAREGSSKTMKDWFACNIELDVTIF